MGLLFIDCPAENIASQTEWVYRKGGLRKCDHGLTVGQNWGMSETTGGFSSAELAREEEALALPSLTQAEAIELGEIAVQFGRERGHPIAVEVRLLDWTVFHVSLPGTTPENDRWIARKSRVVMATHKSTLYERVLAEEQGIDWYESKGLPEDTHAIHGGAIPLNVKGLGFVGILIISGLPQVQDHLLGVEVIAEYLARKGELQ